MKKYIDRYYLNGELYGIKFGGGGGGWQPGANTIAYYPLDSVNTVNDLSGNNINGTTRGNVSFGVYDGIDCCYITDPGQISAQLPTGISISNGVTISAWYKESAAPVWDNGSIAFFANDLDNGANADSYAGILRAKGRPNSKNGLTSFIRKGTNITNDYSVTTNVWYNTVFTYDGSVMSLYVNGNYVADLSVTDTWGALRDYLYISFNTTFDNRSIIGYISNVIFEDKVRTAQEISDYYNQTKSLYGIS